MVAVSLTGIDGNRVGSLGHPRGSPSMLKSLLARAQRCTYIFTNLTLKRRAAHQQIFGSGASKLQVRSHAQPTAMP